MPLNLMVIGLKQALITDPFHIWVYFKIFSDLRILSNFALNLSHLVL